MAGVVPVPFSHFLKIWIGKRLNWKLVQTLYSVLFFGKKVVNYQAKIASAYDNG